MTATYPKTCGIDIPPPSPPLPRPCSRGIPKGVGGCERRPVSGSRRSIPPVAPGARKSGRMNRPVLLQFSESPRKTVAQKGKTVAQKGKRAQLQQAQTPEGQYLPATLQTPVFPNLIYKIKAGRFPDGRARLSKTRTEPAGLEGARITADIFRRAGLPVPLSLKIPDGKDLSEYLKGVKA